jgi:putative component of membrane protein insertase Oxa1/YidC/SpoIIIJ protein YidD/TM2 domain-containing membrane protein YozV
MRRCIVFLLGLTLPLAAGYAPLAATGEWLINAYKSVLSPLQGQQMCNFWPTCSQFTKQAIQSYGFVPGVVMGTDRLLRCQQFAWSGYKRCYLSISHDRLADPVGNHWVGHARIDEPANLTTVGVQSTPAPDTTPTSPKPDALAFADYLYDSEDFHRAAVEYLRAGQADPDHRLSTYTGLMAGEAFLQAGKYADTRAELALLNAPAFASEKQVLTGWSLCKEHRFADAARVFADRSPGSDLSDLAALDGTSLPRRSRILSTAFSAIVPGAGQMYSGRVGDGIYTLLTVVGSGFLTWWFASDAEHRDRTWVKTSLFGTLTTLFYAGNVYGANIAARDYNSWQQRDYLTRAELILCDIDLEPDYSALLCADSTLTDTIPDPD